MTQASREPPPPPNLGTGGGESSQQEDRAMGNLAHTGAQGGTVEPSSQDGHRQGRGGGRVRSIPEGWPTKYVCKVPASVARAPVREPGSGEIFQRSCCSTHHPRLLSSPWDTLSGKFSSFERLCNIRRDPLKGFAVLSRVTPEILARSSRSWLLPAALTRASVGAGGCFVGREERLSRIVWAGRVAGVISCNLPAPLQGRCPHGTDEETEVRQVS